MESIGIDIGSFSVKVARVRGNAKGFEVLGFSEYPLSQDPNKDRQIEVLEIARDIKSRFWAEGIQVTLGAHQSDVSYRRRFFPFRERHKILKALPFELEDDIPLNDENAVYDAKITHYIGQQAHLLAFACPKELLGKLIKQITDGGVVPDMVSVDGVGLANLFEAWRDTPMEYPADLKALPDPTAADLVINIGHRSTTILALKDGYLLDLRQLDWGGKDLAEHLASRYSIHYLEALKELKRRAYLLLSNDGATREQIALSDTLKSNIDQAAMRLRLALLDLQNSHNISFRQAFLTGGVSHLRNLGPYLTQKLEVATNRLGAIERAPEIDFATSANSELSAATAIGLAVEGLKRPKNPGLNLLRGDFAKKSQALQIFFDRWGYTARLGAVLFAFALFWGITRDIVTESNGMLADEALVTQAKNIMGLKEHQVSDRRIRQYIKSEEQKMQTKELLESLQTVNSSLDILKRLSELRPDKKLGGLNVFEFKVANETLHISGEASRAEVITELQNHLRSIARDGKVELGQAPSAKSSGYKAFAFKTNVSRRGVR